jgi:hypothetical protein
MNAKEPQLTTDDLWRVALVAAGTGVLTLFFQALRRPPKKDAPIAEPPAWARKLWARISGRER